MPRQKRVIATLVCFVIQYICSIEAWTNESFNMAESAWLQYMSSAFGWSNSTYQPFLTSNWHFWQMVQMSAQCLLSKNEKAQISVQMQIIYTGWQHCRQPYISYVLYDHLLRILFVLFWRSGVVHILRNHFWGSGNTPPPLYDIVIIWAYPPM